MSAPCVLVVNDSEEIQESSKTLLEDCGVKVLQARTIAEAMELLPRVGEISAILWDGELPDGNTDTGSIQAFKAVFHGPMIATSMQDALRERQLQVGCTHDPGMKKPPVIFLCEMMEWI